MTLANGDPADPTAVVDEGVPREATASRPATVARWRIVSVDSVSPQLAVEGLEAAWIVEPLD